MVPVVARHHAVREVMRDRQRELGRDGDVVIEGRDIGTVVAPDAEVKVFLVADRDERAKRRVAERPGIGADALATDLRLRDESDAARMQPAADATEIDTTSLQVGDVVDRIEALVRERLPQRERPRRRLVGGPAGPRRVCPLVTTRLRSYGAERIPQSGGARDGVQPLPLDRHSLCRLGLPARTCTSSPRSRRTGSRVWDR